MKALFARKAVDLIELKALVKEAEEEGQEGEEYEVIKEIEMSPSAFRDFTDDLLRGQSWIESTDGGVNSNYEVRCIRIINRITKERLLVNSEGYRYPRYTAIEK